MGLMRRRMTTKSKVTGINKIMGCGCMMVGWEGF